MDDKEAGGRFAQARKALGLTQEAIGEKLGMRKTKVSKLEVGENRVTPGIAILMEQLYGVSSDWLLSGDGSMFLDTPTSRDQRLELIFKEANVDYESSVLIKRFMNLSTADRQAVIKVVKALSAGLSPPVGDPVMPSDDRQLTDEELHQLLDQQRSVEDVQEYPASSSIA